MSIKIFISYSTEDKGKMLSLRKRIEKHTTLKAIVVADDRKASKLLTDKVKDGIKDCDYFVCILTSKSIKNQWVNQEIGYATAQGKRIMPIIESGILNKLKGFVHKQMDLPYSVKTAGTTAQGQGLLFSKRAKVLVDDILLEKGMVPRELGLESLFPGLWECEFILKGERGLDQKVEIKNTNEYYTKGRLAFVLDEFKIDLKKGTLAFTKHDPKDRSWGAPNELRIVKLNERYEGTENGTTPVAYYRIDPH